MIRPRCSWLAWAALLVAIHPGGTAPVFGQSLPDEVPPGVRVGVLAGPCSHGKIDLTSCQLYQADIQFYRPFSVFKAQRSGFQSRSNGEAYGIGASPRLPRRRRAEEYITGVSLGVMLGSAPEDVWPVPPPPPTNEGAAAKASAVQADGISLDHGGTLMGMLDVFLPIPLSEAFHIEPFVSAGFSRVKEGKVDPPDTYALEQSSMFVLSYGSGFSARLGALPVDLRAQLRGFVFFAGELNYLGPGVEPGAVVPFQMDAGRVSLFSLTFGLGVRL